MASATRLSPMSTWSFIARSEEAVLRKRYEDIVSPDADTQKKAAEEIIVEVRKQPKKANLTVELVYAAISLMDFNNQADRLAIVKLLEKNPVFREDLTNQVLPAPPALVANIDDGLARAVSPQVTAGRDSLVHSLLKKPSFSYEIFTRAPTFTRGLSAESTRQCIVSNPGAALAVFFEPALSQKVSSTIVGDRDLASLFTPKFAPEEKQRNQHYFPHALAFALSYCGNQFIQFWNTAANTDEWKLAKQNVCNVLFNVQDKRPDVAEVLQNHPSFLLLLADNNLDHLITLIMHSNDPARFLKTALKVERQQKGNALSEFIKDNIVAFLLKLKVKLNDEFKSEKKVHGILDQVLKLEIAPRVNLQQRLQTATVGGIETFAKVTGKQDVKHVPLTFNDMSYFTNTVSVLADGYLSSKINLSERKQNQWNAAVTKLTSDILNSSFFKGERQIAPLIYLSQQPILWRDLRIDSASHPNKIVNAYLAARIEIEKHRANFCNYFYDTYVKEGSTQKPSKELCELVQKDEKLLQQKRSFISTVLGWIHIETDEVKNQRLQSQQIQKVLSSTIQPKTGVVVDAVEPLIVFPEVLETKKKAAEEVKEAKTELFPAPPVEDISVAAERELPVALEVLPEIKVPEELSQATKQAMTFKQDLDLLSAAPTFDPSADKSQLSSLVVDAGVSRQALQTGIVNPQRGAAMELPQVVESSRRGASLAPAAETAVHSSAVALDDKTLLDQTEIAIPAVENRLTFPSELSHQEEVSTLSPLRPMPGIAEPAADDLTEDYVSMGADESQRTSANKVAPTQVIKEILKASKRSSTKGYGDPEAMSNVDDDIAEQEDSATSTRVVEVLSDDEGEIPIILLDEFERQKQNTPAAAARANIWGGQSSTPRVFKSLPVEEEKQKVPKSASSTRRFKVTGRGESGHSAKKQHAHHTSSVNEGAPTSPTPAGSTQRFVGGRPTPLSPLWPMPGQQISAEESPLRPMPGQQVSAEDSPLLPMPPAEASPQKQVLAVDSPLLAMPGQPVSTENSPLRPIPGQQESPLRPMPGGSADQQQELPVKRRLVFAEPSDAELVAAGEEGENVIQRTSQTRTPVR